VLAYFWEQKEIAETSEKQFSRFACVFIFEFLSFQNFGAHAHFFAVWKIAA
jgi:hypothetical protein